jgi:hypothetical protein
MNGDFRLLRRLIKLEGVLCMSSLVAAGCVSQNPHCCLSNYLHPAPACNSCTPNSAACTDGPKTVSKSDSSTRGGANASSSNNAVRQVLGESEERSNSALRRPQSGTGLAPGYRITSVVRCEGQSVTVETVCDPTTPVDNGRQERTVSTSTTGASGDQPSVSVAHKPASEHGDSTRKVNASTTARKDQSVAKALDPFADEEPSPAKPLARTVQLAKRSTPASAPKEDNPFADLERQFGDMRTAGPTKTQPLPTQSTLNVPPSPIMEEEPLPVTPQESAPPAMVVIPSVQDRAPATAIRPPAPSHATHSKSPSTSYEPSESSDWLDDVREIPKSPTPPSKTVTPQTSKSVSKPSMQTAEMPWENKAVSAHRTKSADSRSQDHATPASESKSEDLLWSDEPPHTSRPKSTVGHWSKKSATGSASANSTSPKTNSQDALPTWKAASPLPSGATASPPRLKSAALIQSDEPAAPQQLKSATAPKRTEPSTVEENAAAEPAEAEASVNHQMASDNSEPAAAASAGVYRLNPDCASPPPTALPETLPPAMAPAAPQPPPSGVPPAPATSSTFRMVPTRSAMILDSKAVRGRFTGSESARMVLLPVRKPTAKPADKTSDAFDDTDVPNTTRYRVQRTNHVVPAKEASTPSKSRAAKVINAVGTVHRIVTISSSANRPASLSVHEDLKSRGAAAKSADQAPKPLHVVSEVKLDNTPTPNSAVQQAHALKLDSISKSEAKSILAKPLQPSITIPAVSPAQSIDEAVGQSESNSDAWFAIGTALGLVASLGLWWRLRAKTSTSVEV